MVLSGENMSKPNDCLSLIMFTLFQVDSIIDWTNELYQITCIFNPARFIKNL